MLTTLALHGEPAYLRIFCLVGEDLSVVDRFDVDVLYAVVCVGMVPYDRLDFI